METAVVPFALLADSGFGGWEIVLIIAIVLVLFGARKLPELAKGLGRGLTEFQKETKDLGETLIPRPKQDGLVYEALTHDNRTAEFVYPERSDEGDAMRALILFVAQGFGVGRIPFAPGTFGSLVGLVWFAMLLGIKRYELFLFGAVGGVGVSVWKACSSARPQAHCTVPAAKISEWLTAFRYSVRLCVAVPGRNRSP